MQILKVSNSWLDTSNGTHDMAMQYGYEKSTAYLYQKQKSCRGSAPLYLDLSHDVF